jgi:gamma-glutamyltranspeptidase/glutathione hydrolase
MKKIFAVIIVCMLSFASVATELAPEPASGFKFKPLVAAKGHMVVSGSIFASQAGDEIIKKGGNAIDAAIATQMVLNLTEPQASGIGGGGFLLYYDKNTNKIEAYDGRETAPAASTPDMFLDKSGKPLAYQDALKGGLSVATPGLLRMLEQVHKAHGKLPWKELFAPAIKLSQEGFPLSPRLYKVIESAPYIINSPEARGLYFTEAGQIKTVGTIIKNPALADTLTLIAVKGADSFYKGKVAQSIVETVRNNSFSAGRITISDIAAYKPEKREPLCREYHGYKLCGMPPATSGGISVLQTLKMLEHFNLEPARANSPESIHLIMDAARLAFADRNKYIADCDLIPVPVAGMLAPDYIKSRSSLINPKKALDPEAGNLAWDKQCGKITSANEHPSTTHMSIVDGEGNAVSMTSSIEFAFGSGLMVGGFFLNNELTDFALTPQVDGVRVANRIEPGKRPRSSMSPFLVFDKKGDLYLVIGSPGGSRIISYVLQTIISVLDFGMNLDSAINQPHYATVGDAIELEKNTPLEKFADPLKKLGHNVIIGELTSGLHGIEISKNKLISGVDARREGAAVGE